jgi:fibronectin-binding autotransporter adhesin
MMTWNVRLALGMALVAVAAPVHAAVVLGSGSLGDQSGCPVVPITPQPSSLCYIGVDGTRSATTTGTSTFDFIGLGNRTTDLGAVFSANPGFLGVPSGTLTVGSGTSLTVAPFAYVLGREGDNAIFLGVSNGGNGTLNVTGGVVFAPQMFVGQADNVRATSGTVVVTAGGSVTLDGAVVPSNPGGTRVLPALNIGRGVGSTGSFTVTGTGSSLAVNASGPGPNSGELGNVSLGRDGSGALVVSHGATATIAGNVFASSIAGTGGTSQIDINAATASVGGNVAVGSTTPTPGLASLTVRNGGVLNATGGVTVNASGILGGNGTINGNVTVNGGTVSPGNSPGTLTVNGAYTQVGGELLIEVAGASALDRDLLVVTGLATLQNVLVTFKFTNGFGPTAGFAFDFLSAGGLNITGNSYAFAGLAPGFAFDVDPTSTGALRFVARTNGIPVDEPSAALLLAIGFAGLAALRRRRAAVSA